MTSKLTEKLTGLDHHDFTNMNVAITSLIKEYQRISHLSEYWAGEIVKLRATQVKLNNNRSYER